MVSNFDFCRKRNVRYKIERIKGEWRVFEVSDSAHMSARLLVFKSKNRAIAERFVADAAP